MKKIFFSALFLIIIPIAVGFFFNKRVSFTDLVARIILPTCQNKKLKYPTIQSKLPDKLEWREIGFAKELVNVFIKMVVIFDEGVNVLSTSEWNEYQAPIPWQKNKDRNLLFNKTSFWRSPGTEVNCKNQNECIRKRKISGYSWVDLAQVVCISYFPDKTSLLNPDPGYVVIKTIQKCQALYYENFIYQLKDNKGNFYVMHAFEKDGPNTNVVLPDGWSLEKLALDKPLIITPFGGENNCYYNILGDSLGQGYHQYKFGNDFYPSK